MKQLAFALALFTIFQGFSQPYNELFKLVPDDRAENDRFGYAVAISGNYAIIGAYSDDISDVDPNVGSAYIFEKTGIADWTLVQKLVPSDADDYDRFGWSVAIDEHYAIVGSYREDEDASDANTLSNAGSAYIFERQGDGTWTEVQKIVPTDREAGDEFGWSVSISEQTAVVGAHFESHDEDGLNYIYHTGSLYVFDRSEDGTWLQTQKLVAADRSADVDFPDGGGGGDDLSDRFGGSVDIDGDYLVAGAHHHDYDVSGGSPLNEAGAAYIFERVGGIWTQTAKIQNADRETGDRFAFSVAIDSNWVAIGAPTEDNNLTDAATMANAGSVYLFERDFFGAWNQTQKLIADDRSVGDRFGWSVAIDDSTLIIGASESNTNAMFTDPLTDAGAGYVFNQQTDDTWTFFQKIVASDRQENDYLGTSVSISNGAILLGAFQQDLNSFGTESLSNAGAVYFFSQDVCTPSFGSQTLTLCAGQSVSVGPYTHSETGVYTDLIFTEEGCDSTVTTDLTILPAPSFSQSASICYGYSFDVGGNSHTETGEYTDTLTTVDGCDSIVYTTLTVSPENAVTQSVSICWGTSYTIGASTYTETGTYTDILTSSTLCDSSVTTHLTVELPVNKAISQSLNTLMANASDAEYQWIKCDPYSAIEGATEQTYVAPTTGQYAVIVTENSCTDTSSCVYVDVLSLSTYQQQNLIIYPNPNQGTFSIQYPQIQDTRPIAILINPLGEISYEIPLTTSPQLLTVNNLSPGIYVLMLKGADTTNPVRLVIE